MVLIIRLGILEFNTLRALKILFATSPAGPEGGALPFFRAWQLSHVSLLFPKKPS